MDYKETWIKWLTFINMDLSFRKRQLEMLHVEVLRGFDVIQKISSEEVHSKINNKEILEDARNDLEILFSLSVFSGYFLYLISEGINPEEKNLVAKTSSNELGNKWMEEYERDQCKKLNEEIDPILSMFMEKQTQILLNQFFLDIPDLQKLPYNETASIEVFANWAAHQGFIFAILENKLSEGE